MKNKLIIENWGRIDFATAWEAQSVIQKELIAHKRALEVPISVLQKGKHYLIFCEHPHVYTLGKSGSADHLLARQDFLNEHEVRFHRINRGGDITYHGPGQLVVYPILDLEYFFRDIHRYIRMLEDVVIRTLKSYEIQAYRIEDYTGVWVGDHPKRKICAIGVHMSRWVSMHGLALNVGSDLNFFDHIIPCGINEAGKTVTSMERELEYKVDLGEVRERFIVEFNTVFETVSEYGQKE